MTWTIAWTALCAAGIPTAIVGVLTWYLKKKIEHQELRG